MAKQKTSQNKGNKKEEIRICPKCGSTNVTWDYENAWVVRLGVNRQSCNDCGLKGNFPTIDKDKAEEFRRMLKRK